MDSSPQGSWDWLLHGCTMVHAQELAGCFEDAHALIVLAHAQLGQALDPAGVASQVPIALRLTEKLQPRQG
eukprot:1567249-Lingulodinium_polyedra.AAC.1